MRITTSVLIALLTLPGIAAADSSEEQAIEYLLQYVADSGCTFNRNGDQHEAVDAADHLRLKYSRAGRHVSTAQEFIDRLASASSWSGKPYSVTCDDHTEASGLWLHRALSEYRAGPLSASGP